MYEKIEWKARQGAALNRFTESERSGDTVILTNTPGSVSEPGTPFSAENMNHIEQGIYDAHKAVATEELKRREADQVLQQNIETEVQIRQEADQILQALSTKINSIENLGHYAGAFDTYALLPANTSEYPSGITVNDFATIRADETHGGDVTRYVVREIDAETGDITWVYDVTYTTDISGKADKVTGAADGNLAGLDAGGNLIDSGKKAADFITASDKGAAGGVATLGNDGLVPLSQLPIGLGGGGSGGAGGKKYATAVIGNTGAGHTADMVDFLCTGTDDDLTINTAIQELPENGGKIILLEGRYNTSAPIIISRERVTLEGMGNSTVIYSEYRQNSFNTFGYGFITVTHARCTIRDIRIKCPNDQNTSVPSIFLQTSYCVIENNIFEGGNQYGVYTIGSENIIRNNGFLGEVTMNTGKSYICGVFATNCSRIDISNNLFSIRNLAQGIYKADSSAYCIYTTNQCYRSKIANNICGETDSNAYTVNCFHIEGHYNTIVGNSFNTSGSVTDSNYIHKYVFYITGSNNTVTGNSAVPHSNDMSSGVCSFYIGGSDNIVVGNFMKDRGKYGVILDGDKNIINNNRIISMKYALYLKSGTGNQFFCNNLKDNPSNFTTDGSTDATLPGSAITAGVLGAGGSCGFNIV